MNDVNEFRVILIEVNVEKCGCLSGLNMVEMFKVVLVGLGMGVYCVM